MPQTIQQTNKPTNQPTSKQTTNPTKAHHPSPKHFHRTQQSIGTEVDLSSSSTFDTITFLLVISLVFSYVVR
jgi:hypothetical protein